MKKKGKARIIVTATVAFAALVFAVTAFAACGAPSIQASYVYGEVVSPNSYGGQDSTVYRLDLYDDGSYVLTETTLVYAFSMNLGTTAVVRYGDDTEGATTDGYTTYTLSDANRVILNSYSSAGGFDIYFDTELTTEYPVEMPAESEGEQNFAQNADDILEAYGKGTNVYVGTDAGTFSFTDPNA